MKNVKTQIHEIGGKKHLVILVDLTQDFGPSSTGKSTIVATTSGTKPVEGVEDVLIGLNVMKYQKKGKAVKALEPANLTANLAALGISLD